MSAAAEAVDPAKVRLANQPAHMPRSVAQAMDDELVRHLDDEGRYVARLADEHGFRLDADGLPVATEVSRESLDHFGEPKRIAGRKLAESRLRILALRLEQGRRAEARQQKREADVAAARALLDDVLRTGPQKLERLVELGAEATAAFDRVGQLVRDIEILALARRIEQGHGQLAMAVATAAKALGRDVPAIASLPALPDLREVERCVRVLVAGPGAELLREAGVVPGGVSRERVEAAAETLRTAGKDW